MEIQTVLAYLILSNYFEPWTPYSSSWHRSMLKQLQSSQNPRTIAKKQNKHLINQNKYVILGNKLKIESKHKHTHTSSIISTPNQPSLNIHTYLQSFNDIKIITQSPWKTQTPQQKQLQSPRKVRRHNPILLGASSTTMKKKNTGSSHKPSQNPPKNFLMRNPQLKALQILKIIQTNRQNPIFANKWLLTPPIVALYTASFCLK